MKSYTIRPLHLELSDVAALLAVEQASLNDSHYTAAEALKVLQQPEHWAYLACADQEVVGFCFCFATTGDGGQRLEVDMLGVAPAHRRRGLATRLIAYAVARARERGLADFRTIVATDNVASRTAFQRAGFAVARRATLIAYDIRGSRPVAFLPAGWRWRLIDSRALDVGGIHFCAQGRQRRVHWLEDARGVTRAAAECLHVTTLSYGGIWVEKLWAHSERACRLIGRAVVKQAQADGLDKVGYLQPKASEATAWPSWQREGFECWSDYDILTRRL